MSLPDFTRLDAAIVDLDGTLVDSLGDLSAAVDAMLSELGLPPLGAARVERMIGKGADFLVRSALQAVQAHEADLFPRAREAWHRHYADINGRFARVYSGAREGLRGLRAQGLKLACLTNKPQVFAEALLARTQLAPCFDVVFGGDAFEQRKPHPLPLQMACRALGSAPPRTLMVGDSVNDALAARAAGCPVVLVRYGYNHGQPVESVDADAYIDSIAQLVPPAGSP